MLSYAGQDGTDLDILNSLDQLLIHKRLEASINYCLVKLRFRLQVFRPYSYLDIRPGSRIEATRELPSFPEA